MRRLAQWAQRDWPYFAQGVGLFSVAAACGGPARPQTPAVTLPTYTPEDSALFNDAFRPELFGALGGRPPELDPLFDERVARAGSVVPARVVTLTSEGSATRYSVVLEPTAAVLAGKALSEPIAVNVSATSPIFATFVGTRLLLFIRHYADGPHFYGAADTSAVREAVVRATVSKRPAP